jgi:hypothetical protein
MPSDKGAWGLGVSCAGEALNRHVNAQHAKRESRWSCELAPADLCPERPEVTADRSQPASTGLHLRVTLPPRLNRTV